MSPVAVVTGGGSGIGAATAARLTADGFDVVVTGRRQERLDAVVATSGGTARGVVMDVTDAASVAAAAAEIGACDVLVNNAGGALGTDKVEGGDPAEWRDMFDSNVVGTLQVTQAVPPGAAALASGDGGRHHLHRRPSVVYPGGAGYTAAKHAERALAETLRLELNGEQVRVVEICPGMVHTDGFSLVRFHGDQAKADAVYDGVDRPLTAADVAECVGFCVGLPQHVNIDRLVVKPVAQAAPHLLHRGPIDWGDDVPDLPRTGIGVDVHAFAPARQRPRDVAGRAALAGRARPRRPLRRRRRGPRGLRRALLRGGDRRPRRPLRNQPARVCGCLRRHAARRGGAAGPRRRAGRSATSRSRWSATGPRSAPGGPRPRRRSARRPVRRCRSAGRRPTGSA